MEKTINFSSFSPSNINNDGDNNISLEYTKKLMEIEKNRLNDILNSEINEENLDIIIKINLSKNIISFEYIVLDIFKKLLPIFENKKKKSLYKKCFLGCYKKKSL